MRLGTARNLALAVPFFLAGCAAYVPQLIGPPADPAQYAKDWTLCQAAAQAYKPSLGLPSVAYGAISGGAQNAAGAALNPLVPVLGAAGGGMAALSNGLDVMGQVRENVARHCLLEITRRDHSALVADPSGD